MFLMIRTCLPHMKSGAVVNVANHAGRDDGEPGSISYATSNGLDGAVRHKLSKAGPSKKYDYISANFFS